MWLRRLFAPAGGAPPVVAEDADDGGVVVVHKRAPASAAPGSATAPFASTVPPVLNFASGEATGVLWAGRGASNEGIFHWPFDGLSSAYMIAPCGVSNTNAVVSRATGAVFFTDDNFSPPSWIHPTSGTVAPVPVDAYLARNPRALLD